VYGCVISIDLGSNTLRVLKYDCKSGLFLNEYEKIVKCADNLVYTGEISKEAIDRIVDALNEAKEEIDFKGCYLKGVATEALRRAKNQKEVIEEIFKKSQIQFEVISPDKEANFTLIAVRERLKRLGVDNSNFFLLDIGGGSSELIFYKDNQIKIWSHSLGIVTLTQEGNGDIKKIKELIEKKISFYKEAISFVNRDTIFVATAGTPTTLAAIKVGLNYKNYNRDYINGVILNKEELDKYLKLLIELPYEKRVELVGVGREDLIITGILIFKAFFDLLGFNEAVVVDDGLREGVALELCKKLNL